MEIEVTDATGLPEWLQSHVTEGKLNLAKLPQPEDVTGLKSALQKERENVANYSKLGKPDEIAAKMAELEEKAKGTGKGAQDAQDKLDAMEAKYQEELAARDTRITSMMQRSAGAEMRAELAKAGFIPEAIDDIAAAGMARLQFNDDGTVKVMTADGKPMIGSGADHGATLADLAKELAASKPYAVRDGGNGGGGKPPGSNGGTPPAGLTRSTMKPAQKSEFIAKNGVDAYSALPE